MMEIKIYAPVDCSIKPIEQSTDEMFAQKMMGDGLVIIPKTNSFNSPLEKANISLIFDTKHAIFFESEKIKILMHIGMDTVNLKGEPFEIKVKEKDQVTLKTNIVDVNFEKIKSSNLSIETPICFDQENIESISIHLENKKEFKQGDLIAKAKITLKVQKQDKQNDDIYQLREFKSKYTVAAEQFIGNVGGLQNFSKVYNCMTRLRFAINDKNKVDLKLIEKNELVKGTNWNGNELQVIIGGEVYKVKDEIANIQEYGGKVETNKLLIQKPPVFRRILAMLTGIMTPLIPLLMCVGLLAAIQSVLEQAGVINAVTGNPGDQDLASAIFYILSKVGLNLIGVMFCYSATKYFGGNTMLGILVGLTLTSRFFFYGTPTELTTAGFGDFVQDPKAGIGWLLFKIGDYPILIKGYEGSVLPFIAAALFVTYLDKWVKTWMPSTIDIIFRALLVYLLTIVPILFVFGPFLSFIEYGLSLTVTAFEKIPLGLGVALFAFLWQILVLTGVHVAVIMSVMIGTIMMEPAVPSSLVAVVTIAVFGQVGAGMGVAIITKNSNLRNFSVGALAAGVFGITEPIIYGANLPKVKPFLAGCFGAFVGGLFLGILDIKAVRPAGMGVFAVTGIGTFTDQLLYVLSWVIAIGAAIGFTLISYQEKWDEFKYTKNIFKKINKMSKKIMIKNGVEVKTIEEQLINLEKNYLDSIQEGKDVFKDYMKYMSAKSKLDIKLITLKSKEEKIKQKLYLKAKKLTEKDGADHEIVKKAIAAYNIFNLDDKKSIIESQLKDLTNVNKSLLENYAKLTTKLDENRVEILANIEKLVKFAPILNYNAGLYNGIYSVEISFGIKDQEDILFSKQEKIQFKQLIAK
ncbi:glucose PTS transporter subunit IIA [Spiroplasma culicicola]|uniref:PTS system beta-glucoside-specific IIABC component n=1 Tax=Spiroplasma culicicola AES-1 TaxID=1276246 RepID=W6A7J5_9MOLU|nr:glucose PTS transporter subunit IIA [Spiroplasma culicicola]AHI52957.1 PTS system beta-glucoside-specific IIABC component [Spiroplasma culicicola AES-1]